MASIVVLIAERAGENHWSNWLGKGASGGGGIPQLLTLFVRDGQLGCCQRGLGLLVWGEGGRMDIKMRV